MFTNVCKIYVSYFYFELSYAILAAYSDTLVPLAELFFLSLMTNPSATSFIQDIKPCGPLLLLIAVPCKEFSSSSTNFCNICAINSMLLPDAGSSAD